jgi:hypothetical protein
MYESSKLYRQRCLKPSESNHHARTRIDKHQNRSRGHTCRRSGSNLSCRYMGIDATRLLKYNSTIIRNTSQGARCTVVYNLFRGIGLPQHNTPGPAVHYNTSACQENPSNDKIGSLDIYINETSVTKPKLAMPMKEKAAAPDS